jgi:hypothetical protein
VYFAQQLMSNKMLFCRKTGEVVFAVAATDAPRDDVVNLAIPAYFAANCPRDKPVVNRLIVHENASVGLIHTEAL